MKTHFEKKLKFEVSNSKRIVAVVFLSLFKLQWMPNNKWAVCREIFENELQASCEPLSSRVTRATDSDSRNKNFIVYSDNTPHAVTANDVQQECILYPSDTDTNLIAMNKYKTICQVQYNCAIIRSNGATVQRCRTNTNT